MDLALGGKVALITGGSRGIGRATALALAREGADVAVLAGDLEQLAVVRELLARVGVRAHAVSADTSSASEVDTAVADIVARLGRLDIVVNAAARPATVIASQPLADLDDAEVLKEIDAKAVGYLRVARAAAPHLISAGWGRIINVAGLNARLTGSVAGTMRNVAVVALTKNLADELGPLGVTVNAVHPGYTVTERSGAQLAQWGERDRIPPEAVAEALAESTSSRRLVTAEEVADVVTFLASPRSVAINGEAISVDGGRRGHIWY